MPVFPVPFITRRDPTLGKTFYPVEVNQRLDEHINHQQAPIPPAQSEVAGPVGVGGFNITRARMPIAFFFHHHVPWGDDFLQVGSFGRPMQRLRGADEPRGFEQGGFDQRRVILRRPAIPYGNRGQVTR